MRSLFFRWGSFLWCDLKLQLNRVTLMLLIWQKGAHTERERGWHITFFLYSKTEIWIGKKEEGLSLLFCSSDVCVSFLFETGLCFATKRTYQRDIRLVSATLFFAVVVARKWSWLFPIAIFFASPTWMQCVRFQQYRFTQEHPFHITKNYIKSSAHITQRRREGK